MRGSINSLIIQEETATCHWQMKLPSCCPSYMKGHGNLVKFSVMGKRGNITPIFKKGKKDARSHKPVSLTSLPGRIMEQIFLKTLLRQLENKDELIGGNQHDFTEGKLCLMYLEAFCNGVTASVNKGRAADVIYLTCAKRLTLFHMTSWLPNLGRNDLMDG